MTQTFQEIVLKQKISTRVISLRDLQYCYRNQTQEAVDGINLDIHQGDIFGLIGPDGTGKTTTFQMLAGVMPQTGGMIKVLGSRPQKVRLQIGYLTQRFSLYPDLSILENLRYGENIGFVSPDATSKILSRQAGSR